MATKVKGKILDGQIAFDFFGENQMIAPKKAKEKIAPKKVVKQTKKKLHKNIKPKHLKKHRKTRRIPRKLKRSNYDYLNIR